MPKNPLKGFARRKSSGNVLDLPQEAAPNPVAPQTPAPAGSSFRVLERPDKSAAGNGFVKRTNGVRPASALPLGKTKGKSTEDLVGGTNRGSGGTALSGSSGYFDNSSSSARYSSSSTLPSSIEAEQEAEKDELFPRKSANPSGNPSMAASPLPEPPSFTARAGRAMSFGLRSRQSSNQAMPQTAQMPGLPENSHTRDRATTMSSYASTAVPPRLESNLGATDFGNDFGNMFEGLNGPKKEEVSAPLPTHGTYNRSDSEPILSYASRNTITPSPEPEAPRRPANLGATNRYSWASRTSNDGLMSPALGSDVATPPLQAPSGFARFKPGYQPVPDRYASPANDTDPRAASSSSDEDVIHDQQVIPKPAVSMSPPSRAAPTAPTRNTVVASVSHDDLSSTGSVIESQNTTPRARNLRPTSEEDSMFDTSSAGPSNRALHPAAVHPTPRTQAQAFSPSKRMTRLEYEQHRAETHHEENEESEESDEGGFDDDDEAERQAELARQRRKQEANMSVYRQQMKKVSGGNPSELPSHASRPSMDRASLSAPGLSQNFAAVSLGAEAQEEDEDVPLGILQAHGFPSKSRPPTRLSSAPATPGYVTGSVMGDAGGALPPFARNLPADPYFGAGLVHPVQRESLAFGSGGSVYGGAAPAVQPMTPHMPHMIQQTGGLVGVIAGEERARAARRANPSVGFGHNPMALPNNMQYQMPPMMPRSNSMMSMGNPAMGGFMPQMPPMMSPQDMQNQHQMMQMMQMQHQMMQQMMQMQQGQMAGPMPPMPNGLALPNMPNGMQRPMSMNTPQNPNQQWNMPPQRSSTMTNLKPPGYAGSVYDYSLAPPGQGYTPSIAPSERSNVGMPSRYRPVTMEGSNSRNGTLTSESGIAAFAKNNASTGSLLNPSAAAGAARPTIKVIDKPKGAPKAQKARAEEEDEEEGWAQLRKKREQRKRRNTKTTIDKQQEQSLQELYQSFE